MTPSSDQCAHLATEHPEVCLAFHKNYVGTKIIQSHDYEGLYEALLRPNFTEYTTR